MMSYWFKRSLWDLDCYRTWDKAREHLEKSAWSHLSPAAPWWFRAVWISKEFGGSQDYLFFHHRCGASNFDIKLKSFSTAHISGTLRTQWTSAISFYRVHFNRTKRVLCTCSRQCFMNSPLPHSPWNTVPNKTNVIFEDFIPCVGKGFCS